ncbi:MAG: hypothetical protein DHS20C15_01990 [Planctomycetota bacterium]|nr:MAG: hypothetical protein DHS20C15_01990 [Planctomycetota bacterium]
MSRPKDVLTTGDVARICRVTIRTVIKWFEKGRLEGYRLPGSRDRRFTRVAVERFLRENGMPLDLLGADFVTPAAAPSAPPAEPSPPEPTPPELPLVLVVDDDEPVRRMIRRYLETLGSLRVETAASGWEAGLKTATLRPALLLLDFRLGDTTGDEVVRTIRAMPELPQPAIVLMSAHLQDDDVQRVLELGANAFVPKPFDLELLRATLFAHLESAS